MFNRILGGVLALAFLAVSPAFAGTVDVSGAVNSIGGVALAAFGVFISWAAHRAVSVLERWSGSQLLDLHGSAIDDAVQLGVSYVNAKLEAVADPAAKLQIRDQVIAQAAQMIALQVPNALEALSLTPEGVAAKLKMHLGLADPTTTPVLAAPAPVTTNPSAPAAITVCFALALLALPLAGCFGTTPSTTTTGTTATSTAAGTATDPSTTSTPAAPTADQQAFDNACWSANALDAAFKIAATGGKIPNGIVTTEQDVMAGVETLCNGPAPTDFKDAVTKLEAAAVQIAAELAGQ